jgi:hypothetical protein
MRVAPKSRSYRGEDERADQEGLAHTAVRGHRACSSDRRGLLYGGADFFGVQFVGVASVFAFCFLGGLALFKVLAATVGLRVTEQEEIEGLDIGEHGNIAYPEFRVPEFTDILGTTTGRAGGHGWAVSEQ